MKTIMKISLLLSLLSFVSLTIAKEGEISKNDDISDDQTFTFPYVAAVTEDNVYLRSGPGTNYYPCGKVNKSDTVKAIASQYSWTRIVPPKGSFSWISKQYVQIDPNTSTIGTITGDAVRVYAGSENLKPIYSTTIQVKLNEGEKVELIDDTQKNYYKIAPPAGAYLWISTQFTQGLTAIDEDAQQHVEVVEITEKTLEKPKAVKNGDVSAEPAETALKSKQLKQYYTLKEKIETERAKNLLQQNYTQIKHDLTLIVEDQNTAKASRYARFTIEQIEKYELAYEVEKAVRLQDAQFEMTKQAIDDAKGVRLSSVDQLGKYTVVGTLQLSNIFGSEMRFRHFTVLDSRGNILCYALPDKSVKRVNIDKLIGKRVGLIGSLKPFVQTNNSLISFRTIELLEKKIPETQTLRQ